MTDASSSQSSAFNLIANPAFFYTFLLYGFFLLSILVIFLSLLPRPAIRYRAPILTAIHTFANAGLALWCLSRQLLFDRSKITPSCAFDAWTIGISAPAFQLSLIGKMLVVLCQYQVNKAWYQRDWQGLDKFAPDDESIDYDGFSSNYTSRQLSASHATELEEEGVLSLSKRSSSVAVPLAMSPSQSAELSLPVATPSGLPGTGLAVSHIHHLASECSLPTSMAESVPLTGSRQNSNADESNGSSVMSFLNGTVFSRYLFNHQKYFTDARLAVVVVVLTLIQTGVITFTNLLGRDVLQQVDKYGSCQFTWPILPTFVVMLLLLFFVTPYLAWHVYWISERHAIARQLLYTCAIVWVAFLAVVLIGFIPSATSPNSVVRKNIGAGIVELSLFIAHGVLVFLPTVQMFRERRSPNVTARGFDAVLTEPSRMEELKLFAVTRLSLADVLFYQYLVQDVFQTEETDQRKDALIRILNLHVFHHSPLPVRLKRKLHSKLIRQYAAGQIEIKTLRLACEEVRLRIFQESYKAFIDWKHEMARQEHENVVKLAIHLGILPLWMSAAYDHPELEDSEAADSTERETPIEMEQIDITLPSSSVERSEQFWRNT
jgi:hypothetical protein